jgi:hypothetical protein
VIDGDAPTLADGDGVIDADALGDADIEAPIVGDAVGSEVGLGDSEAVIEGVGTSRHSPRPSHVQPSVGGTKDGVSPGQRVIP